MITRILTLIVALAALSVPLAAQSMDDVVKLRLLQGWKQADGTLIAGVEIALKDGWKTYWRAPGDAGIPPSISWGGSANLADIKMIWPAPVVFHVSGARSIGYTGTMVLPLQIAPKRAGKSVQLHGKVEIGVCKDICIPVSLRLDGVLEGATTRPVPAIAAALASRPLSAKEAGVRGATCALSPIEDGLRITATLTLPKAGGREVAVIETGDPQVWVSEAKTTRNGRQLMAVADMYHANGGGFALDRSAVRFTVLGRDHSVDIQGCEAG